MPNGLNFIFYSAFLGWMVLAPFLGGRLCRRLEERLTGASRAGGEFRVLRLKALSTSYVSAVIILGALTRAVSILKLTSWFAVPCLVALSSSATVWIEIAIYKRLLNKYLRPALRR